MPEFDFHKNTFTRNILERTHHAQEAAIARGEGIEGENNWHTLRIDEKYIMRVFNLYVRLDHVLEQLQHVSIYLKRFSPASYYEKENINGLIYTQYHMEVYIHKIHTVLDLMRLMVNRVYEFNIADENCTWSVLKDYPGIKGSIVESILNSYWVTFKDIINGRNLNTHRGWFEDSDIERLSSPLFLIIKNKEYELNIPEFKEKDIEYSIRHRVQKLRLKRSMEMQSTNKIVYEFINRFYEAINKIFDEHLNAIHKVLLHED